MSEADPCDITKRDKPHFCPGLERVLSPEQNSHRKGFTTIFVTKLDDDLTTRFFGVAYKTSAKDKGIFVNFCPFCGEDLKRWLDQEKQKKTGT